MLAIPQVIAAALALLSVFLLGCIIGWFLRLLVAGGRSGTVDQFSVPDAKDASPARQDTGEQGKARNYSSGAERQSVKIGESGKSGKEKTAGVSGRVAEKPPVLSAPRNGKADDLKKIRGVGPKLEKTLNNLGVYHFDQISSWNADEIAWVDDNLSFRGRIERDGWVSQAKKLQGDLA